MSTNGGSLRELNAILTDRDLAEVSTCIGSGWRFLAYTLGLKEVKVQRINDAHPNQAVQQIEKMLFEWRQLYGRQHNINPSWKVLVEAMMQTKDVTVDFDDLYAIAARNHPPCIDIDC